MKNVVLITRPEDDAVAIAYAINQKKYSAFCEPFLDVVFHDTDLPNLENYKALIFTSSNGVRAFVQKSDVRNIPVFTVGDNTLEKVRRHDFAKYKSAQGNIDDLIAMLADENIEGAALYVRGEHISTPLKGAVAGLDVDEITLYHTEKPKEISVNCLDLLREATFSHVLFFSKRTAETFVELISGDEHAVSGLNHTKALCLGDSMIECLSVLPWQEIVVAAQPNRDGLLELLENNDAGERAGDIT